MIVGPAILFLIILELVRRRRLREDYSLIWLGMASILVMLSLFRNTMLYQLAELMGIQYHPTALFVIGFGLMLLILLQYSLVITRLTQENRQAAQHIALLKVRLSELEHRLEDQASGK
jgi:hypothetical protein